MIPGMSTRPAKLSPESREAFRAEVVAHIPSWYSPWLHLGFPSLVGLGLIAACAALLRDLRPWELLVVPVMFLVSNATEWRAHRDLLHRRTPGFTELYDRHTPIHHRIFLTEDMAIRSAREFRLVLIPAFGILVIFAANLPLAAALWLAGLRNVAALFIATDMAYVLLYEWLHLSYHLPPESLIGRSRPVRFLRQHHATHHDPDLMQKWNFNVTIPLWDWVRGTIWRQDRHGSEGPRPEMR